MFMDTIIVDSGQKTQDQPSSLLHNLRPDKNVLLTSSSRLARTILLLAIVVIGAIIALGGHWAATSLTLNLSGSPASTTLTTTQSTTSGQSTPTSTQTDSTVGGTTSTGTAGSSQSAGATTTGTPPPLGSVYHNLAFVGDSITAGWINDGAHAYPILTISGLYSHNTGNGWYQLVKGRSGAVSAGALLDLQTFGVQPKNVNLMVVELGTNDMVHMTPTTFQTNYQSLISYLMAGSPNAQLVCLSPWRAATDNFGYGTTPGFEAVIQNICKEATNGTDLYVDLSGPYANKTYHNTTGETFHPNNAGAQAIANAIVTAIYK